MESYKENIISIIIPIYNAEKYLQRCIDSVLNQTYSKLEVILIDDGSTDDSRRIIESYVERDLRVHAIYKNNGGPNSARKAGIMQATGSYAMFVDADDYLDLEICEKFMNVCNEYAVDIVGCGLKRLNIDGTVSEYKHVQVGKMDAKEVALNIINTNKFFEVDFIIGLVSYFFNIKIIKNILYRFDERIDISEDVICMFLALWDSNAVYLLDEPLYINVSNQESISHEHTKSCYKSQQALYYYGLAELHKRSVPSKMYINLEQVIIRDLLILGYTEAFGHLDYLFPFRGVLKKSKLVVYGAGDFGIEIVKYINQTGNYELIRWVDKNQRTIHFWDYPIQSPTSLVECKYDYVIVAVTKPSIAKQIVQALLELNIEQEKIKTIHSELISYDVLPKSFFEKELK